MLRFFLSIGILPGIFFNCKFQVLFSLQLKILHSDFIHFYYLFIHSGTLGCFLISHVPTTKAEHDQQQGLCNSFIYFHHFNDFNLLFSLSPYYFSFYLIIYILKTLFYPSHCTEIKFFKVINDIFISNLYILCHREFFISL